MPRYKNYEQIKQKIHCPIQSKGGLGNAERRKDLKSNLLSFWHSQQFQACRWKNKALEGLETVLSNGFKTEEKRKMS